MNDMTKFDTSPLALSDDPARWAPPEAPIDMPRQVLETTGVRFDIATLLRVLLPRQRT
ncbi:hypothetical protein [Maritimibacter sp. DP1N21-5]|uniref:hypothetical protein n=1 Tax=Maritimibacter sp. DP1N21-5 TaxID=2836867 RepID=UPI001C44471E|nr:hypothetical protein [Maritimibacter sp. DP1N21-5]MBV7407979.1 hypothetical protein [Maritimibacter sp. DP1N21-5]